MPKTRTSTARSTNPASPQFDRIAATCAALIIVGLAVFLLVRNEKIADPQLFFVMRVVLSFSTAVLGATIPGFLEVGWSGRGLAIRAGGALALFVLTFLYTPDLITKQGPQGQSGPTTIIGGTTQSQQIGQQTVTGATGGVTAGTISGGTYNLGEPPGSQSPPQPPR
jgi:heme A synthase